MDQKKQARREAMGDNMGQSMSEMTHAGAPGGLQPQPIPSAPQGRGNLTNNFTWNQAQLPQMPSLDGSSSNPYDDARENYAQMGVPIDPKQVPVSPEWQGYTTGRGFNKNAKYGLQEQPSSSMEEGMEGLRLGKDAQQRGLFTNQYMGIIGMPNQPIPGDVGRGVPQQSPASLQLNQSVGVPGEAPPLSGGMNTTTGQTT